MVLSNLADELAAQAKSAETDLDLARDASAFYLKLSESVLLRQPEHLALAEAVASGFTQYAYAFVAMEADQIEARDAKAAEGLRRRAARLYERAHGHAMRTLEREIPDLRAALTRAEVPGEPRLQASHVGLAYWAASAWGGWISLSKHAPDVVADLPAAIRLAQRAWELDPDWGEGALTGLLATFETVRPGGSRSQALTWFDQAIAQGQGRSAAPLVAKAENYAQPAGDRALFQRLLTEALTIQDEPGSGSALKNEVMRRRARWLLDQIDDLFLGGAG
jgi:predicted anti-sigma-YlaC factor YlaD